MNSEPLADVRFVAGISRYHERIRELLEFDQFDDGGVGPRLRSTISYNM